MRLSDIEKFDIGNVKIIRDNDFDYLVLLGKKKVLNGKYLSFLLDKKYINQFIADDIDSVICKPDMSDAVKEKFSGGICLCDDPKTLFFNIHEKLYEINKKEFDSVIDETAEIHPTANISSKNVIIGPNVKIGAGCVIKANVEIAEKAHIEELCVIGSPAFYYYGNKDKRKLVQSTGGVRIGRNVGIHSHVTIEKGVFYGNTIIEDNCAIDNFVLIEHDCRIGENTILAGNVTLAGGITVGKDCYLGVGSVISNNIKIGDNVRLCVGSAVSRDIPPNSVYAGNYAIEHDKFIQDLKSKLK